MTNQQGAPEAHYYEMAAELRRIAHKPGSVAVANTLLKAAAALDTAAALVEAQQPAAHVQNPAETEHVTGDVSKNGPESNMKQQPAPSAAAAVIAWRIKGTHYQSGWLDGVPSDEQVKDVRDNITGATLEYAYSAPQPSPTPQADSQPAPDERDDFEKVFPLPSGCIRVGTGYASTGYSNWAAHTHCERWQGWQARAARAPADSVTALAYSIDADPQGIRARVADAISGALAFGAQGANPPPAEHWLAPFWETAREEASRNTPVSSDTLYLLRRLLSNQHTLTGSEFRAELEKIVGEAAQAADSVLEDAARLLRQILTASQDGDSDTHLSAHFVSRIETITKAGGAA